MDRFIAFQSDFKTARTPTLKSNMDRFIGLALQIFICEFPALKSNMDRFIVANCQRDLLESAFKIQYG